MEENKMEVKQEDKIEYVTKKDFDALQSLLIEALGTKKQQPKEEVSFDTNLRNIEEEKQTRENIKREIELQDFFDDDMLYDYTEDEKLAMVNLSKDEIELTNIRKLSNNSDVLEHLSNSQRKEIDKVLKDGSKQDKLNFKYTFIEYYKEALEKFINQQEKIDKELGKHLSKQGVNIHNKDSFNVDSIRNPRLRNQVQQLKEKGAI